jgi:pimeloyl-ACP methyl ester carboxylesterase
MSAFYFGPPDRPLFGFAHPPTGTISGAVLVCQPWGIEYQYAHRALRALGDRLAECGRYVLRFDYSGAGDSWGSSVEADLERWHEDAGHAAEELRLMSGVQRLDVVGLRLGGVVAGGLAARDRGVDRLVLWDPVTSGSAWVREVEEPAREPVPVGASPEGTLEFDRHVVSSRFLDQLRAISPQVYDRELAHHVLHLVTGDPEDPDELASTLEHVEGRQFEHLPEPIPWVEDVSIWAGQIPARTLARIVAWLEEA